MAAQQLESANTQPTRGIWDELVNFTTTNRHKVLSLAAASILLLSVIGMQNVAFWDDSWRRMDGYTGWASIDGRVGSELVGVLLNAGTPLIDLGLTSFVLTGLILTAIVTVVIWTVVGTGFGVGVGAARANWLTFLLGLAFILNPWALNAWAFRFDGPMISLGLLIAIISVVSYPSSRWQIVVATAVCTYVAANFFQPAIGFVLIMFMGRALRDWLSGYHSARQVLARLGWALIGFLVGGVAYFAQISLSNTARSDVGVDFANPFTTFTDNLRQFLGAFRRDNAPSWLFFTILIGLLAVYAVIYHSRKRLLPTLLATGVFFLLSILASGGVLLLATTAHISRDARFRFPLAMVVGLLGIIAAAYLPRLGSPLGRVWQVVTVVALIGFSYLWLANVFIFANTMAEQRRAQELQASFVFNALNQIREPGDTIVYDPIIFTDSVNAIRVAERFPIYRNSYYVGSLPENLSFDQFRLAEMQGLSASAASPFRDIWTIRDQSVVCELPEESLTPIVTGPRWEVWRSDQNTICATFPLVANLDLADPWMASVQLPLNLAPLDPIRHPWLNDLVPADLTAAVWLAASPDQVQWVTAIDIVDGVAIFPITPPDGGWPQGRVVAHFFITGQYLFQQVWQINSD